MRVDFYHLIRDPATKLLPALATRVLEGGGRLLVVADDPALREQLSDALWDAGPASFLAHDQAGAPDAAMQPILLSDRVEAANGAGAVALADGLWRDEALGFARAFLLFDESGIEGARAAWRTLGNRDACERHYWKQVDGRWREGP